jgi:ABC-type multidrug transport system fused ATPase/permease subunit
MDEGYDNVTVTLDTLVEAGGSNFSLGQRYGSSNPCVMKLNF